MRIGLVGPTWFGCNINPGWHMIADGIRYLVRKVDQSVEFVPIEMSEDNPKDWIAAEACDAIIICGNPRFSRSDESWWECGVLDRLVRMQLSGIKVIDGWPGAAVELSPARTVEQMAKFLMDFPRTKRCLELSKIFGGRISRDAVIHRLYAMAGVDSVLLPCSSWWAASYHHVDDFVRDTNAIVLLASPGHAWMADEIKRRRAEMAPCRVVATTWNDYAWATNAGLCGVDFVPDIESLLRFYARCKRVLSFRIHSAIPAASVGCEVCVVAVDSRALTCELFNLPSVSVNELPISELTFAPGSAPSLDEAQDVLQCMLQ